MISEDSLSPEVIERADPKSIYELLDAWPERAEETLRTTVEIKPKQYKRVVYLAVGGSATAGDIVSDWFLTSGGVEVSVFRGDLPKVHLANSLVIICSTSGDTSETLNMAEAVRGGDADIVTISHGGELSRMAEREGLAHVEIGLAKAPRFSLPYSLFASIAVLRSAGLLEGIEWELDDAVSTLKEVFRSIRVKSPSPENPAKRIAQAIGNREPCIYASSATKSVARRFKNSLNENAKIHAMSEEAPDLFHNEVEAWERDNTRHHPVILRRGTDPASETRAFDAFVGILASRGVKATRVDAVGESNFSQLMSLCFTLDFASYYSAILSGAEPFSIALIDELKRSR